MDTAQQLESIKHRIRSLVSKTVQAGCTEAEANLAAEKVGDLLEQYNLSLTDVMLAAEKCILGKHETTSRNRTKLSGCAKAIGRFTDCIVYSGKNAEGYRYYAFFGLESDVSMAKYLCEIITSALNEETAKFKRTDESYIVGLAPRKTLTNNFQEGFVSRINHMLDDMKETKHREHYEACHEKLPILAAKEEKVKHDFKELGITLKKSYGSNRFKYNSGAYSAGSNAASNVNLSRPVNNSGKMKMLT